MSISVTVAVMAAILLAAFLRSQGVVKVSSTCWLEERTYAEIVVLKEDYKPKLRNTLTVAKKGGPDLGVLGSGAAAFLECCPTSRI